MSKGDASKRELRAGDGIYEGLGTAVGLWPPNFAEGSGQPERIEAVLNGEYQPQWEALTLIRKSGYQTEKLEKALRPDQGKRALNQAIKWTRTRLDEDYWNLQKARLAALKETADPDFGFHRLSLLHSFGIKDSTPKAAKCLEFLDVGEEELRNKCLPPGLRAAYSVLLRCCCVRLALLSEDTAKAVWEAINIGSEYARMQTQRSVGDEVVHDREAMRSYGERSRKGTATLKERTHDREKEYQDGVEALMDKNRKLSYTGACERYADLVGIPPSRVKRRTHAPQKTGYKP